MKKEVILAIVLGIVFGLVITFGIYTANKALRQRQQGATQTTQEESPEENSPNTTTFTHIISPEDGSIVSEGKTRVTGTTFPGSLVVIFDDEGNEYTTTADSTGNFSEEIELVGGSNAITTVVTNQDGKQEEDTRLVVYSTANLDEVASPSATPRTSLKTPTPSATPKATPKATTKPKATP